LEGIILKLRLASLFQIRKSSIIASLVVAGVVYFQFSERAGVFMNLWLAGNLVSALGRFFYTSWAQKQMHQPLPNKKLKELEWGYALQLVIFGSLWVAVYSYLQESLNTQSVQILLICYFGILAGGLSTLTASKLCSHVLVTIFVGNYTFHQLALASTDANAYLLALAGFSFWVILVDSLNLLTWEIG